MKGNPVTKTHGLAESLEQIEALPEEERERVQGRVLSPFRRRSGLALWLDGGALCVAHAGMKEAYIGRASGRVRDFALYGETTGETDEFGLPVRYPWAQDYRGTTTVVYGHTPVPEAEWLNNTLNLDTGCVFGGKLTALRWPEREMVQVPARADLCGAGEARFCRADGRTRTRRRMSPCSGSTTNCCGRRMCWASGSYDAPDAERDRSRRERRRRAGGDEPVRRRTALAALSAAHDVALRDRAGRRLSGTSCGGVRLLSRVRV